MEAAFACCSGIDIEALEIPVESNFQDVRMAGDEEMRMGVVQLFADSGVVSPGITSDVCHHDVHLFDCEMGHQRILQSQRLPVDVPTDGTQRLECCQSGGQLFGTDVARMPDFVTLGEVLRILVVPPCVGIRKKTDFKHTPFIYSANVFIFTIPSIESRKKSVWKRFHHGHAFCLA